MSKSKTRRTIEEVANEINLNVSLAKSRKITIKEFKERQRRLWGYAESRSPRFVAGVEEAACPEPWPKGTSSGFMEQIGKEPKS